MRVLLGGPDGEGADGTAAAAEGVGVGADLVDSGPSPGLGLAEMQIDGGFKARDRDHQASYSIPDRERIKGESDHLATRDR